MSFTESISSAESVSTSVKSRSVLDHNGSSGCVSLNNSIWLRNDVFFVNFPVHAWLGLAAHANVKSELSASSDADFLEEMLMWGQKWRSVKILSLDFFAWDGGVRVSDSEKTPAEFLATILNR